MCPSLRHCRPTRPALRCGPASSTHPCFTDRLQQLCSDTNSDFERTENYAKVRQSASNAIRKSERLKIQRLEIHNSICQNFFRIGNATHHGAAHTPPDPWVDNVDPLVDNCDSVAKLNNILFVLRNDQGIANVDPPIPARLPAQTHGSTMSTRGSTPSTRPDLGSTMSTRPYQTNKCVPDRARQHSVLHRMHLN